MKQQETQTNIYEIDDFQHHCHLFNIFAGGSGKGLVLLRKIVDAIQANNYSMPGNKLPSILLVGQGKDLIAKAIVNSLKIEDIRVCKAHYFENTIFSYQFFFDSLTTTAHIIEDIGKLRQTAESVLWRYIEQGRCPYYRSGNKKYDFVLYCNGILILTAKENKSVSDNIAKAVDYVVTLEPYTIDQLQLVAHQYLKFCGIDYDGEKVLQEIVGPNPFGIRVVIKTLKTCIILLKAEMLDCLTIEIVKKAKRLIALPAPPIEDDIPF